METRKDFFISRTGEDREWAKWIAGTLENEGYSTIVQDWDFLSGNNFVEKMDWALKNSKKTIVVWSEAFEEKEACKAEWSATLAKAFDDAKNFRGNLLIARIENHKPTGLLAPLIYFDLFDKTEEEAKAELLKNVSPNLPDRTDFSFPGTKTETKEVRFFPGALPFNNLPPRNPHFTGRKAILEKIHRNFEKGDAISRIQALRGLGGMGKSEIAKEYAFRYAKEYDCIWWVNAETVDSVQNAYFAFAGRKKIIDTETNKIDDIIEAVRTWMSRHDKWLFIFDNVEDDVKAELDRFRPAQNNGHLLITSQNTDWNRIATLVDIGVFLPEEATDFFDDFTKLPKKEKQAELAEALGYLPLALEQAAAYICSVAGTGYAGYLKIYNRHHLEVLKEYPNAENKTVYTTWNVSFEKIKTNESAKQLLNLCAFFAPDNLPCDWFTEASEFLPQPLQSDVNDELRYADVRTLLAKYSLIKIDDNRRIHMHRLLQDVVRATRIDKPEIWANCGVQILNKLRYPNFSTAALRSKFMEIMPHIVAVIGHVASETTEIANLYVFLGYGLNELANYPEALEYYKKALAIREKVLGESHPSTATTYNNIALIYVNQGNYPEALAYFEKALAIFEKVLGKEHPSTATSYNNIASVYKNQGRYPEALAYYKKDLAICEKVLGKEHPSTATSYNNIASVYYNQGNYPKALAYFEKALAICENVLGKEHPSTATTYNNIASVYDNQGNYPKAMEYYEKALAIREKVLGKEHPDTAVTYNNIAGVYKKQGRYPEALAYYEKALTIKEKVLGKEHPSTATTYINMAGVYCHQFNYPVALALYLKSYKIRFAKLGTTHPDTINTKKDMKTTYLKTGNPLPFEEWLAQKMRE
jgi:tetratricopeptide (TPR) repeat protein